MKIIYNDSVIYIAPIKAKTTVKNLLKYVKPSLNTSPHDVLILLEKKSEVIDKHSFLDDHTEIDLEKISDFSEYIILRLPSLKHEEKTLQESVEKIIMLVTNAKHQIQPVKSVKRKWKPSEENFEFLDQIISTGNLPISSLRLRNEIANIINNPFINEGNIPSFFPNYNNFSNISSNRSNLSISNSSLDLNIPSTNITNIPNINVNLRQIRPQSIEPNPTYVQNLVDMGFPEDRAKMALVASRNNLNNATEIILSGLGNDEDLMENNNYIGGKNMINKSIMIKFTTIFKMKII